ncbi:MAG: amidohydrolase family protein, partial [Acidobacteriota bacterium]
MVVLTRIAAAAALLAAVGAAAGRQAQLPADLVLLHGRVITVDEGFTTAAALAVREGRFVAVGSEADIRPLIGPATRVIDAAGRTVMPGIIDTHVHALDVAAADALQPFQNLASIPELQAWVRTEAGRRPEGSWIWTPRVYPTRLREHRFPTKAELDLVAPR